MSASADHVERVEDETACATAKLEPRHLRTGERQRQGQWWDEQEVVAAGSCGSKRINRTMRSDGTSLGKKRLVIFHACSECEWMKGIGGIVV